MNCGTSILLALVCALLIHLPKVDPWKEHHGDPAATPESTDIRFTTTEVIERCSVSCWSVLGGSQVGGKINIARLITARCKPEQRTLWLSLLLTILSGDVQIQPGPRHRPRAPQHALCVTELVVKIK